MTAERLTRRSTLAGVAAAGVGLPLLSACGGDSADDPTATGTSGAPRGATPGGSGAFASTSDVPVGGCAVYSDAQVVVTQPAEGDFRCFTAVCTHQGCLVSSGSDGVIPCKCHGSEFALEDGAVLSGPASSPLEQLDIVVEGDEISLA